MLLRNFSAFLYSRVFSGRLGDRLALKECGRCRLDLRGVRDGHPKMCSMVRGDPGGSDDMTGVTVGSKYVHG